MLLVYQGFHHQLLLMIVLMHKFLLVQIPIFHVLLPHLELHLLQYCLLLLILLLRILKLFNLVLVQTFDLSYPLYPLYQIGVF